MGRSLFLSLLLPAFCFTFNGWAQVIQFEKFIDLGDYEWGSRIIQLSDGNYVLAGHQGNPWNNPYDIFLMKTNPYGDSLLFRAYPGYFDYSHDIELCPDGGYIFGGSKSSDLNGYVIRTDSMGDTLFTGSYGWNYSTILNDMKPVSDGGYILCGSTSAFTYGTEVVLIKIDANGNELWKQHHEIVNYATDIAYQVVELPGGNFMLGGRGGYEGTMLMSTDPSGNLLWTKTYYGKCLAMTNTDDGGYVFTGNTDFNTSGGFDAFILKTNAGGDSLWGNTIGSIYDDEGRDIAACSDGGYVITGLTSTAYADPNVYLIKTDGNGNLQWERNFGIVGTEAGYSVQQCSDGGYIILGDNGHNLYMIKTDSTGSSGVSTEIITSYQDKRFVSIYPQPVTGDATVIINYASSSPVELRIIDCTGRTIRNYTCSPTARAKKGNKIPISKGNLRSGIYFYQLISGNIILESGKIVVF